MFGKRLDLFQLFGITIRLDASWFLIAALLTFTLARGSFPNMQPGLSTATYWVMGAAGALGLFVSVLVHEFAHALVARRKGISIRGITLFFFGGVAEMDAEPPSPKAEFLTAGAGPLMTLGIAGLCFGVAAAGGDAWPRPVGGVIGYLGAINALLAAFNLVPAFPLDGGRMLRAGLWHWKRDLRRATRIAAVTGSAFGMLLIGLGLVAIVFGNFLGGLWWALIGMFLRSAASASYQQVLLRQTLEGEPVRRFMRTDPVTVPATLSLEGLVEDYVYRHHHELYPVSDNGRLAGCITTQQLKAVPRVEWRQRTVGSAAVACAPDTMVRPDMDASEALAKMRRSGSALLLVVEGERLVGLLTLKDLLSHSALKLDLES